MIVRMLALAAGVTGAVGLSQFPAFSQQYTQRLAGAVDELAAVTAAFDADAAGLGLSREAALHDLAGGSGIGAARAGSMRAVFARHEKLSGDLKALRGAGPVGRAVQVWRMTDTGVARKAWADFRPALPVTVAGAGFAGAGFVIGWGMIGGVLAGLRLALRRRRDGSRRRTG